LSKASITFTQHQRQDKKKVRNSKMSKDIYEYFDRLWENKDGLFTINFDDEPTTSGFSDFMYKILDTTQLGSF